MVFAILVETTWPILVLRRLCWLLVVSAIYFFLAFALAPELFFLALEAAVVFLAAAVLRAEADFLVRAAGFALARAGVSAVSAASVDEAAATALLPFASPSSFSRMMVLIRATSLRNPRSLFRLSDWPILSWNFMRKSWSFSSRCWCVSSASVKFLSFSTSIVTLLYLCQPLNCYP